MNSDGTINTSHNENYNNEYQSPKKLHHKKFYLLKRYSDCNCKHCWKNFILSIIFYTIILYLLYFISKNIIKYFKENEKII